MFLFLPVDMMEKKYCPVVHRSVCRDALSVLKGFVSTPTLKNTLGRAALHGIFNLCAEMLDSRGYNRCHPMNLGGGAIGYEGSCTFARWVKSTFKVGISSTNCSLGESC